MGKLQDINMYLSFFKAKHGGSGILRGTQPAEYLNARINPESDFEDDVCIYVKLEPPEVYPKKSWLDIIDAPERLRWLDQHPTMGVIANSRLGHAYLSKRLNRNDIVLIPEHHCNYERWQRPIDREVKVVGVCGNPHSIQIPHEEIKKMIEDLGLEYRPLFSKDLTGREQVANYYKDIDIQIVWRPRFSGQERLVSDKYLRNPIKLANAGSYGIPTVAFPEPSYVDEFENSFIHAETIDQLIEGVRTLKNSPELYGQYSTMSLEYSEVYHMEHISKLYLNLLK